jgi:SAM-dependent methyltransferase
LSQTSLHPFSVRLSRKLQKLFSRDAAESLWEHTCRWTHPVSSRRILATIDLPKFARLREQYPYRPDARKINKWEDANYWVKVNVERAQDLWLDRTPPLRILDLGSGAGYFLYVCRFLGHEGVGLDVDVEPLFRGTTALLNVQRVISRIDPGVALPDLGQKFDLLTAHRVCFNRIERAADGGWKEWSATDWRFFISDIRTRFLRPGGRLLLDFNPQPDGISFFAPELRAYFLSEGARIFRSKALFAADPAQRPRFRQP